MVIIHNKTPLIDAMTSILHALAQVHSSNMYFNKIWALASSFHKNHHGGFALA